LNWSCPSRKVAQKGGFYRRRKAEEMVDLS